MPYKCEYKKVKLGEYDRRRKLTDDQKEEIKKLYKTGLFSQRKLAEQFGVSRRLITIIVNPESAEKVRQRIKEHWKEYQQTKEEHAKSMRELRKFKKDLYDKGLIKEEKE